VPFAPTRSSLVIVAAATLLHACALTENDTSLHSFANQTVRIIVGFSPGGNYDLHARVMANHLGRHLPGHPAVVVENMPGAGGRVATNYLAHVARPDGLTIGHLAETNAADAVESDLMHRLLILVSPAPIVPVFVFSSQSGIASVDDWRRAKRPPRIASSGPGASTFVVPHLAKRALGLPMQIVSGYSGSAEMRLALEGGEVDGICLNAEVVKETIGATPNARAVLRFSNDPIAGLDAPDAMSLATGADARALLETGVYAIGPLSRFYAAPRNIPAERAALLREGLARTLADAQFLAAAATAGLTIAPVSADVIEEQLRAIAARRQVLDEIRSILSSGR
jgi:tripartite-type tricarboxylate transporter receptor subunit TctC